MENKQPLVFSSYVMPGQKEKLLIHINKGKYCLGFIIPGRSEVLLLEFQLQGNCHSNVKLRIEEQSNIVYNTFNKKGSISYKKNRGVKYYTELINFVHSQYLKEGVKKYDYFTLDKCCYYLFFVYCYNAFRLYYIDFGIKTPFDIPNVDFYNEVFCSQAMPA